MTETRSRIPGPDDFEAADDFAAEEAPASNPARSESDIDSEVISTLLGRRPATAGPAKY